MMFLKIHISAVVLWDELSGLITDISIRSVFVVLIFYFLITFFLLVFFIFLFKLLMNARKSLACMFQEECRDILFALLNGKKGLDDTVSRLAIADTRLKKNLLIGEIMYLHKTRTASEKLMLRQVYKNLLLDKVSIRKLKARSWHVKIQGFHELSEMKIKEANKQILKYTSSKNPILRIEAELSSIRLLPFVPFAFLDSIKRNFSLWEQINVYELIRQRDIEIPEFSLWLNSPNPSVINYSLNMIRVLKQNSALPHITELYAKSDHSDIRLACLQAIRVLKDKPSPALLIGRYHDETYENKKEIISILQDIAAPESVELLVQTAFVKDFSLRRSACISLLKIPTAGAEHLKQIQKDADPELYRIIQELLTKEMQAA